MELIRKKIKPFKNDFAKKLIFNYYKEAIELEKSNKPDEALALYKNMLQTFNEYYDLDSIKIKTEEIENSKEYKKISKVKQEIEKEEMELIPYYSNMLFLHVENPVDSIYIWWKNVAQLLQSGLKSKNIEKQKMNQRVINNITGWCYEYGNYYSSEKLYSKSIFAYQLLTIFRPANTYPYYKLAVNCAILGEDNKALSYLKDGIKKGLTDKDMIADTPEFQKFSNNKKFIKLLENM